MTASDKPKRDRSAYWKARVRKPSDRQCEVKGCDRPVHGNNVCSTHNSRMRQFGSYDPPPRPSMEQRFWRKVAKGGPDECWPWTKGATSEGYGQIRSGDRQVYAHRYSYEFAHGPLPEGRHVDHVCHNQSDCPGGSTCQHRRCVNPAHLEAVENVENILRGKAPTAQNARKETCTEGHVYDATWARNEDGKTRRGCRTCHAAYERARQAAIKGAA